MDVLLFILSFIVSLVPSILIVIWMYKRKKQDPLYKKSCTTAVKLGLLCVLPILVLSGTFAILNRVLANTVLANLNPVLLKLIYNFIVIAFVEELVKFIGLKITLRKKYSEYTWADVVAFMVIIGTMFGLVEDIPYAIDATPIIMLIRGFTMGHVGYAFIMGWFYGKRLYTGKKRYGVIAFVLPFVIHGCYDFSLAPEFLALNEYFAFFGITLALLELVCMALFIRFMIRSRKIERYNTPLITLEKPQAEGTAENTTETEGN